MKAMAVIGYIISAVSAIGGFMWSLNPNLNSREGLTVLLGGIVAAFLFALPSTALIGIVQIRSLLKKPGE